MADRLRLLQLEQTDIFGEKAIVVSLSGREEISRPYEFIVTIASPKEDLKPADVIGKPLGIRVDRGEDNPPRYFHGYISHFWAGDFSQSADNKSAPSRSYRIRLVPWLWFLTRAARCFVYLPEKEKKSIQDVLEEILKRAKSYGHVETWNESGNASILKSRQVEHCVQYRETDYHFLARTLENYGVYYYFRHEKDKHTLVLSDRPNYEDCMDSEVAYERINAGDGPSDSITSWEHAYEFVPGKWSHTDYNFETPSLDLMTSAEKHSSISLGNNTSYEIYDYPGDYQQKDEGEAEVVRRLEEEEARFDAINGTSSCRSFQAGMCFVITKHPTCPSEENKGYLITSISHSATQPGPFSGPSAPASYSNRFTCIPKDRQYRSPRLTPRPMISSVQTAVIVGPSGEEIYTDKYGRVKVQFHWDREGKRDENTSCWVRVTQVHAGKGFGGIDIPRVGEEVVVSFLEGDPDRPLITGRVYHNEAMPPFGLPAKKTVSGIKTKTYKGKGFNEVSLDDTPGKEMINIHAQYDMLTTVEHDHTVHIKTGNHKFDVDTGTATITVKGAVTEVFKATQSTNVQDTIDIKTNTSFIHVESPTEIKLTVGSSTLVLTPDTIKLVSPNIVLEAPTKIKGTSPLIQLVADSEAKVSAPKVEISGTQTAEIGVGSQTVKCDTSQVGVSGAAINSSATGQHDITGAIVKIN